MGEIIQRQDSRKTFIDTLNELNDPNIICLIPDVGFLYFDHAKFRVINTGCTELSTIMIATGLSLSGKFKVFAYSMINFILFGRAAEAVRNGVVCHGAPITILGVKGSSSYKFLGFSHNLLHDKEDFNFCDNISLKWHAPQNNEEVRQAVIEAYNSEKPSYIRLG